jgi:hypothetical protein
MSKNRQFLEDLLDTIVRREFDNWRGDMIRSLVATGYSVDQVWRILAEPKEIKGMMAQNFLGRWLELEFPPWRCPLWEQEPDPWQNQ